MTEKRNSESSKFSQKVILKIWLSFGQKNLPVSVKKIFTS